MFVIITCNVGNKAYNCTRHSMAIYLKECVIVLLSDLIEEVIHISILIIIDYFSFRHSR